MPLSGLADCEQRTSLGIALTKTEKVFGIGFRQDSEVRLGVLAAMACRRSVEPPGADLLAEFVWHGDLVVAKHETQRMRVKIDAPANICDRFRLGKLNGNIRVFPDGLPMSQTQSQR